MRLNYPDWSATSCILYMNLHLCYCLYSAIKTMTDPGLAELKLNKMERNEKLNSSRLIQVDKSYRQELLYPNNKKSSTIRYVWMLCVRLWRLLWHSYNLSNILTYVGTYVCSGFYIIGEYIEIEILDIALWCRLLQMAIMCCPL